MNDVNLVWHGYNYFPYELEFARREVEAVLGRTPREVKDGLQISQAKYSNTELERLTYFHEAVLPSGERVVTNQARLEASARKRSVVKEMKLDGDLEVSGRQRTRYSAHGLHEYKGKFNPQVVRAIGNMLALPRGANILDVCTGSGTTLLECAHAGWNAIGIDLNPLAVFISNAKLQAVHTLPDELERASNHLVKKLNALSNLPFDVAWTDKRMRQLAGDNWRRELPNFEYLASWFPMSVLAQFAIISCEMNSKQVKALRPVFEVIMSDMSRTVSLQDPGDLRMRRRKEPQPNYPLIPLFTAAVSKRVETILRARRTTVPIEGAQQAVVADNRESLSWMTQLPEFRDGFNAGITSPPYATALPYIDTQRLSLCLLDLVEADGLTQLEKKLIGTREISGSKRRELEATLSAEPAAELPATVTGLCDRMLELATLPDNGFRRKNMPALVYRYFRDMARVLQNVREVMRSSGRFALVVGRNRTTLGGEDLVIDTPHLLADIAVESGWELESLLELETYQRFEVHQRNSINTESLVVLRRV
jgi:site-specific DNA-methyltransferase (cytosine-N4-specific)